MYEQPTETDQLLQGNNSSDGTSNEKSADSITLSTSICLSELLSMENENENIKTTVAERGESTINHSSLESKPADSSQATVIITTAEDAVSIGSVAKGEMCRICHCYTEDMATLISPCGCNGSMRYVHQACLQKWVKSRDTKKCELCGTTYNMISSVKPFRQWKKLDMSSVERRKILCSVTFHIVAITCVIWSLYVLIDRTTQEIINGNLNWPFWTKLVVVAIGFTGGLVFMYVQCKMYVQLFKKWKQFNRVIYINDVTVESNCSDGDQGRSDTETTAQAVNVTSRDT